MFGVETVVSDIGAELVVSNVILLLLSISSFMEVLLPFPPVSLQCAVRIWVPSSRGFPNTKSQIEQGKLEISPIIIDYSPALDEASISNLDAALETSPKKVMDDNFVDFGTCFEKDSEPFDSQIVNVIILLESGDEIA